MSQQQHPIYAVKAEFLRTLGHPVRVRILELLRDGERTVGYLQDQLALDSSRTSQHVGVLRRLGVLEPRRVGTSVYYTVRDERIYELLAITKDIVTSTVERSHSEILDAPHSRLAQPGARSMEPVG